MEIVLKRIAKKNLYIGRLYLLGVPNFDGMVVDDSRIWGLLRGESYNIS